MRFSIEVDNSNPTALTWCLKKLEDAIPDFEYDWHITINAGGIDYGIYLNIDTEEREVEISNGSTTLSNVDSDDCLDDVFEYFDEEGDDDE